MYMIKSNLGDKIQVRKVNQEIWSKTLLHKG